MFRFNIWPVLSLLNLFIYSCDQDDCWGSRLSDTCYIHCCGCCGQMVKFFFFHWSVSIKYNVLIISYHSVLELCDVFYLNLFKNHHAYYNVFIF